MQSQEFDCRNNFVINLHESYVARHSPALLQQALNLFSNNYYNLKLYYNMVAYMLTGSLLEPINMTRMSLAHL